jgi:hypothetical protein
MPPCTELPLARMVRQKRGHREAGHYTIHPSSRALSLAVGGPPRSGGPLKESVSGKGILGAADYRS